MNDDKESEAIITYYVLYGHYAPMHVHAVKKGKETRKSKIVRIKSVQ